jgi:translation initiation factor IF-1
VTTIAGKEDKIDFEGEVVEAFRNGMYKILLDNGHETLGYTAGKMRRYRIKILPGDRVNVELSPYDLDRGRIVYRHREEVPGHGPGLAQSASHFPRLKARLPRKDTSISPPMPRSTVEGKTPAGVLTPEMGRVERRARPLSGAGGDCLERLSQLQQS